MKRLMLVCVMILCLILSCGAAQAVDWEQYAVDDRYYVRTRFSYDGDNTIILEENRSIIWERNGERFSQLLFSDHPALRGGFIITGLPDGTCGLLLRDAEMPATRNSDDLAYQVWDGDTLRPIREWHGAGVRGVFGEYGFLVSFESGEAMLYDFAGQEIWHGTLGEETCNNVQSLTMRSETDWSCVLFSYDGINEAYVRVRDGEIIQRRRIPYGGIRVYTPLADGLTAAIQCRNDGEYGPVSLSVINSENETLLTKKLSGDRLIVGSHLLLEQSDGTLAVYGSAVANSRRIYLVWRLVVDSELNLISLDVRDCSYHRDYGPGVSVYQDGSCWVSLEDYHTGAPDVRVPFTALPVVSNHSLKWE